MEEEEAIQKKFLDTMREKVAGKYDLEIEEEKVKHIETAWCEKFTAKLWQVITHSTEGIIKQVADNKEESGLKSWMKLMRNYDQLQTVDKQSHMAKSIYTERHFGRAKTHEQLRAKINDYEQELARFNEKYGEEGKGDDQIISKDMQLMAIKLMLPEEMLSRFKGDMPKETATLKEEINNYIDDCRATKAMNRNHEKAPLGSTM